MSQICHFCSWYLWVLLCNGLTGHNLLVYRGQASFCQYYMWDWPPCPVSRRRTHEQSITHVLCHCEQSIRLTPNPISCYVIKRSLSNDCNVCVTTVWSALPACVVNKLGEEISHVRRRSTGKHASKRCLPFSIISFFSFDNVRLNIDALKLLQRSWGEREWALLWQRTKGVLRVLLTGWGIWKRRKQKDLR